jgi:hypothetical protein
MLFSKFNLIYMIHNARIFNPLKGSLEATEYLLSICGWEQCRTLKRMFPRADPASRIPANLFFFFVPGSIIILIISSLPWFHHPSHLIMDFPLKNFMRDLLCDRRDGDTGPHVALIMDNAAGSPRSSKISTSTKHKRCDLPTKTTPCSNDQQSKNLLLSEQSASVPRWVSPDVDPTGKASNNRKAPSTSEVPSDPYRSIINPVVMGSSQASIYTKEDITPSKTIYTNYQRNKHDIVHGQSSHEALGAVEKALKLCGWL